MVAKAKEVAKAKKALVRNTILSEALKAQATEFGVILGHLVTEQGNASDMFRKAAVALSDMQSESRIGKMSDTAAIYVETIGRAAWHEIHKHLGKAAPEYKRGANATINMGLMRLSKISLAFSVDGHITAQSTGERWNVKAALLDMLGKERGFNMAVKFAYSVLERHQYLCTNDLDYASTVGYDPEEKTNGRPKSAKTVKGATDATIALVAEKVRVMNAEQCYTTIENAGSQLVMFVSAQDPKRVDVRAKIMATVKDTCAQIRRMLAESQSMTVIETPRLAEANAKARKDEIAQAAQAKATETAKPMGEQSKPKRTRKAKQSTGIGETIAA